MNRLIYEKMLRDTEEEKAILNGEFDIEKFYDLSKNFEIKSDRFLKNKQIDIRTHTRYIDFPNHEHDYMEIMYVYSGKIVHHINNEKIVLESGDILLLNKHITHSIEKAKKDDIGINIIIGNDFLKTILEKSENSLISSFLIENFKEYGKAKYLFFHTQSLFPFENIMDNLIYELTKQNSQNITILSGIISLIFNYLNSYNDLLVNKYELNENNKIYSIVNEYIEQNFTSASLKELSKKEHYSMCYLSKLIHKTFGKSFKELVINKRLEVSQKLLLTTNMKVYEISYFIGYENLSYFYNLFYNTTNMTPEQFRTINEGNQNLHL